MQDTCTTTVVEGGRGDGDRVKAYNSVVCGVDLLLVKENGGERDGVRVWSVSNALVDWVEAGCHGC